MANLDNTVIGCKCFFYFVNAFENIKKRLVNFFHDQYFVIKTNKYIFI